MFIHTCISFIAICVSCCTGFCSKCLKNKKQKKQMRQCKVRIIKYFFKAQNMIVEGGVKESIRVYIPGFFSLFVCYDIYAYSAYAALRTCARCKYKKNY